MGKNVVGAKILRKCAALSGQEYGVGYARGGTLAIECWFDLSDGSFKQADLVDWRNGKWCPLIRDGQFTKSEWR